MTLKRTNTIKLIRIVAILAAAVFIWIGVSRGEVAIVMRKAIRICLECIGVAG